MSHIRSRDRAGVWVVGDAHTNNELFNGIDQAISDGLGVENYGQKSACLALLRDRPIGLDGKLFVSDLFDRLKCNWARAVHAANRRPSQENFRWFVPKTSLSAENTSPEVTLERALINACLEMGRTDWSNQVPIISGLVNATAYRRRAIDLVRLRGPGAFDLVELKVASDTPLFASMEILLYGLLWLLSRNDRLSLGYESKTLLEAESIRLCVLAPRGYYDSVEVSEFGRELNLGLAGLGGKHGIELGFSFQAFPPDFRWPHGCTGEALCRQLDGIGEV